MVAGAFVRFSVCVSLLGTDSGPQYSHAKALALWGCVRRRGLWGYK